MSIIVNRGATRDTDVWRKQEMFLLFARSLRSHSTFFTSCISSCIEQMHVCELIWCTPLWFLFTHLCLHLFSCVVFMFTYAPNGISPRTTCVCSSFVFLFRSNTFVYLFFILFVQNIDQHLLQWHIRDVQIPWRRDKMLRLFSASLQWARILLRIQSTLYRRIRCRVNLHIWLLCMPHAPIFFFLYRFTIFNWCRSRNIRSSSSFISPFPQSIGAKITTITVYLKLTKNGLYFSHRSANQRFSCIRITRHSVGIFGHTSYGNRILPPNYWYRWKIRTQRQMQGNWAYRKESVYSPMKSNWSFTRKNTRSPIAWRFDC